MNAEVETLKQDFDPHIVRIELEGLPTAGAYRGIAEVQEHVRNGPERGPKGDASPRSS